VSMRVPPLDLEEVYNECGLCLRRPRGGTTHDPCALSAVRFVGQLAHIDIRLAIRCRCPGARRRRSFNGTLRNKPLDKSNERQCQCSRVYEKERHLCCATQAVRAGWQLQQQLEHEGKRESLHRERRNKSYTAQRAVAKFLGHRDRAAKAFPFETDERDEDQRAADCGSGENSLRQLR